MDAQQDIERILKLPVKDPYPDDLHLILSDPLRTPCGGMTLRPNQARSLYEMMNCWGFLGRIPVGGGKTLISALAPTVMGLPNALILTKARLKQNMVDSLRELRQHWKVHDTIQVWSYSELSQQDGEQRLQDLNPDLIIGDECHKVSRFEAARTQRLWRFAMSNDSTRYVFFSGTLYKREITELWHLAFLALDYDSPYPIEAHHRIRLGNIVDAGKYPTPKDYAVCADWANIEAAPSRWGQQKQRDKVRDAVRERIAKTPGILMVEGGSCDANLEIYPWSYEKSPEHEEALDLLHSKWQLPNGDMLWDAVEWTRAYRQLRMGFYYIWDWPDGIPDEEWLEARSEWGKKVRTILKKPRPGMDTPGLVYNWFEEHHPEDPVFRRWSKERQKPKPPTLTIWVCDKPVRRAVEWAREQEGNTIIWSNLRGTHEKLAELVPFYGGGDHLDENVDHPVVGVSIKSFLEGWNAQYQYANQLVLTPPTLGRDWEQLLGRTHRAGQPEDTVRCSINTDYAEEVTKARDEDARFGEQVGGATELKLNIATWVGDEFGKNYLTAPDN